MTEPVEDPYVTLLRTGEVSIDEPVPGIYRILEGQAVADGFGIEHVTRRNADGTVTTLWRLVDSAGERVAPGVPTTSP